MPDMDELKEAGEAGAAPETGCGRSGADWFPGTDRDTEPDASLPAAGIPAGGSPEKDAGGWLALVSFEKAAFT